MEEEEEEEEKVEEEGGRKGERERGRIFQERGKGVSPPSSEAEGEAEGEAEEEEETVGFSLRLIHHCIQSTRLIQPNR